MAASIPSSTVKTLDMDAMHMIRLLLSRLRERCPVNVMIGPPESKDDDLERTMRLFFGKDGSMLSAAAPRPTLSRHIWA